MKSLTLSLLLGILVACNKSDEDSTGSLKFSFASHYGSEPFRALQAYSYLGNQSIKFSKFDFYITGVQLISTTGTLDIDQHALIDLTSSGSSDPFMVVHNIKPGEYTAVKLMVGVTPDLNKKLPKDFNSNDALSSTSHYWDAWNSFIFPN
jgi:hypothetical protein